MPLSYAELEQFYEGLVARARRRGIACAITSGMACVAFGVAQATQDCDLLCAPEAAGKFLDLLERSQSAGPTAQLSRPSYPATGCTLAARRLDQPLRLGCRGRGGVSRHLRSRAAGQFTVGGGTPGFLRRPEYGGGDEAHQPGKRLAVRDGAGGANVGGAGCTRLAAHLR